MAYHWVSKFKKEGGTGSGMTEGERELDRIKRENERLGTENEFLKNKRLLRQEPTVEERYLLMAAERASHPVKMMARLRSAMLALWGTSRRIFGARQILHGPPAEFDGTTLYRVRKLVRKLGIEGVVPHGRKRTTIPDEGAPT